VGQTVPQDFGKNYMSYEFLLALRAILAPTIGLIRKGETPEQRTEVFQ
jgi:hypothetical protein